MLASEQTVSDFALPAIDVRGLARRAALPALVATGAVIAVLLLGGRVHEFVAALLRGLELSPAWAAAGVVFEALSLTGYVLLLSLVAGRATSRVGARESAQITLAGAAATRLLPTAGAGGLALALWALRRAGLRTAAATRTLLTFLVLLYSTFLAGIVVAGAMLTVGVGGGARGPAALSAVPAAIALLVILLGLALAARPASAPTHTARPRSRLSRAIRVFGGAVRDACRFTRSADARLAGAVVYWLCDATVLWAMLNAFGSAPAVTVVALAYLVGQVATTVPIPGSVSGGIAGVLIAFGVPLHVALPAVLAYRAIAVWLPAPVAAAAVPRLRATIARWSHEDAASPAGAGD
jgi:putative heme transporter